MLPDMQLAEMLEKQADALAPHLPALLKLLSETVFNTAAGYVRMSLYICCLLSLSLSLSLSRRSSS